MSGADVSPEGRRVLVAYATKYGATAGIAEKIGRVLTDFGLPADVMPVHRVGPLENYRAMVLGSAVYAGQWRKEASLFMQTSVNALAAAPMWLFSSGPTGAGDPIDIMNGWRFPTALQPLADHIAPLDIAFFHGAIDMAGLSFPERILVKAVKAPPGDFRDWDAIDAWASQIAAKLIVRP